MKKINQSISRKYLPVKIYLDDLDQIVTLFNENNIKYSLETDNYKYESLEELIISNKEKEIKSLKIKTDEPYITIEFTKLWTQIYFSSDEPFVTGLFHKINSIINNTKRLFPFFYSYYFVWTMNIFLLLINIINKDGRLFPEYIDTSIFILYFLWLPRVLYIRLVKHSSIQLLKKEHVSNFFHRKRDDLILALVSGLFGAILGVLATILTTKFLK
ncbi:MAG: hypothetical protein ACOVSR_16495 [Bacteroidia bacterium]